VISFPVTAKMAAGIAVAATPAMAETTFETEAPAGDAFSLGVPGAVARLWVRWDARPKRAPGANKLKVRLALTAGLGRCVNSGRLSVDVEGKAMDMSGGVADSAMEQRAIAGIKSAKRWLKYGFE
jgi:hypothetical protein